MQNLPQSGSVPTAVSLDCTTLWVAGDDGYVLLNVGAQIRGAAGLDQRACTIPKKPKARLLSSRALIHDGISVLTESAAASHSHSRSSHP